MSFVIRSVRGIINHANQLTERVFGRYLMLFDANRSSSFGQGTRNEGNWLAVRTFVYVSFALI